ncbi:retrovirus-related pol polyprotein from transposon TNT 1-94 [Tanacetum coccineum]
MHNNIMVAGLRDHPPMLARQLMTFNEIHAEKIAKNANPLALVAAAQQYPDTYYQVPKPYRSYAPPAKTSPSTRSHATTRHKGKESKKPRAVPIRPRKPIRKANQSVVTPPNKIVASNSTIQESKSTIGCFMRKLIVQLILFIVDSRCTKHMTGNLKLLCNFVEKYLGTIHFRNDQFAPILEYGDLGNDLLSGNRGSDLYTISLQDTTSPTPICFMAKASPTQAWLWHRRLSHLNFDTINLLSKKDIVNGLPNLKYVKDQLCSSCEPSKAKRSTFKTKTVPSLKERLNLLLMDLCGPMRIESINGKKYILELSKASDYDNSNPAPQLQQASDHNSSELGIQDHNNEPLSKKMVPNVSPLVDTNAPSLQELDFLFSPLFEEYFTAGDVSLCGVWKKVDTTYWGFLGVDTTFDIFQNILFLYGLNMAYWYFLDTAYWILFPSWSLVKCRHRYAVSSLMDTAYWSLEQ